MLLAINIVGLIYLEQKDSYWRDFEDLSFTKFKNVGKLRIMEIYSRLYSEQQNSINAILPNYLAFRRPIL